MPRLRLPVPTFVLWILALFLAGAGQRLLVTQPAYSHWAAVLFAFALLPAWLAWGRRPLTVGADKASQPPAPRWWAILFALLAVLGTWIGAANNTFTWWGVTFWVASVVLWLVGWRALSSSAGFGDLSSRDANPIRRWQLLAFVTILLVAAFFRFWQIDTLPAEMTSDHAEKLLDVMDVLEGERPIFFIRNTGREPLQFYLTALLAGPLGLGLSHLALKVGTALVSLLTVPLTYLVARRGMGLPRNVALLAMALLAVSKWHVSISRVGLRFPYAPFGVALTLLFFLRALRLGARRDWILAGIALGVSLYGYTPVRILPLLLAVGGGLYLL
ncbi:MAG: glycosyltransferase family 39 protein, partial [Chloroflexota bacterium]|nr:glycosyltransferase family 39 protein [Chloroflexota bacterium]